MPYALVVQPQLVSILDFHGNPTDVWVVEAPSWLAKFLSESTLNEENQIEAEPQLNPFPLYCAPRSRSSGCKVEEIVDQEEPVPLAQGSPDHFHGNNCQNDDSLNSLPDEGFCQIFSNSGSSSSSPNTSQEIIPNENYSLYEDPCIVHVQAYDDFVPTTPLYQSSFPSLMGPYPMYQQQEFQQQPYFHNSMMSNSIPYSHPQFVYNHHQMQFQQNRISPPYSEALLGDYIPPIPAQKPVMTAPDPFSLQTCNGAYLIQNKSNKVSGFISFSNQELGFSHPLGQVCKTQRSVKFNFLLDSGKTCYVKAFPHCIKFSSSLNGVAYLIDEAGVRTCWESFNDLEPEVTQGMWKRDCELGVKNAGRSHTFIRHQRFAAQQMRIDPPTGTITELTVPEGESVVIKRKGMRMYSETRELSNITLSTYNFSITSALNKGSGGGVGHILMRCSRHRFRQSVIFDGKSLKVKFHTQSASLGKDGKLSLSK